MYTIVASWYSVPHDKIWSIGFITMVLSTSSYTQREVVAVPVPTPSEIPGAEMKSHANCNQHQQSLVAWIMKKKNIYIPKKMVAFKQLLMIAFLTTKQTVSPSTFGSLLIFRGILWRVRQARLLQGR